MTIVWRWGCEVTTNRRRTSREPIFAIKKKATHCTGWSYLVAPFGAFLSSNWIRFSGNRSSYFIEMKSQVVGSVINPVISHNDNWMAVMRFALRGTKRAFFRWSVCLQRLIYGLEGMGLSNERTTDLHNTDPMNPLSFLQAICSNLDLKNSCYPKKVVLFHSCQIKHNDKTAPTINYISLCLYSMFVVYIDLFYNIQFQYGARFCRGWARNFSNWLCNFIWTAEQANHLATVHRLDINWEMMSINRAEVHSQPSGWEGPENLHCRKGQV